MGKREPLSPLTKWIVLYRDNFTCRKCGKKAMEGRKTRMGLFVI